MFYQNRRADFHLFDLPLYRRKDGSYVLHRVVNFGGDGSYTMCGDNQFAVEKGITDDDIVGVVTAFYRKGKPYTVNSMKYRAYLEFMFYSKPLRKVIASTVSRIKMHSQSLKPKKGKKSGNILTITKKLNLKYLLELVSSSVNGTAPPIPYEGIKMAVDKRLANYCSVESLVANAVLSLDKKLCFARSI